MSTESKKRATDEQLFRQTHGGSGAVDVLLKTS